MNIENCIGHHLNSKIAKSMDWQGYWPEINSRGIITAILDGDCIPEDAVMVDWSSTSARGGHAIKTDGEHGFEAILA